MQDNEREYEIAEALGRIEGTLFAMRSELLGNGQPGRIQRLEDRVNKHEKNQWFHSAVIVPLNFLIHAITTHFGVRA